MDRASWVRVIERWFARRSTQNGLVFGCRVPSDAPVLQGPTEQKREGTALRSIRVYFSSLFRRLTTAY